MTKDKFLATSGLWVFQMVIFTAIVLLFPELISSALNYESFLKGMAIPLIFAVISKISVEKGDIHARKN